MAKCEGCYGQGQTLMSADHRWPVGKAEAAMLVDCPTCGGTGRSPDPVAEAVAGRVTRWPHRMIAMNNYDPSGPSLFEQLWHSAGHADELPTDPNARGEGCAPRS
jgi:hypothetical protein